MTGFTGADRNYHYGGGPPSFLEREINLEFEGGALINKAYSDMVQEDKTLDANIMKGMPYGRNQSEANKPTLEFPLMNIRASRGGDEKTDEEFQQILNNLMNKLPKDVKERLAKELNQPQTKQNPAYSALGKSLAYTAAALALMSQATKSFEGNARVLRYAQENLGFTEQALKELIRQGKELLREGYATLKQLGRNHPHFDTLLKHLKNAANALKLLKRISDEEKNKRNQQGEEEEEEEQKKEKKEPQKETEGNEKSALQLAIERVEMYKRHYHESFSGENLLMIGPLLSAITAIGRTQSLNDGLRSMLLGLIINNMGTDELHSRTSSMGEGTNSVITKMMDIVRCSCLDEIDARAQEFFPLISKSFVALCVTGALYLITTHSHHEVLGESLMEEDDEHLTVSEETLINTFTLWNLIVMFLETNMINRLVPEDFLDPQYGLTDSLGIVTKTIEFTTISIIIRAVKQYDEDASNLLLSGLATSLIKRTNTFEEVIDNIKTKDIKSLGLDRGQLNALSVQLINCRIALQNEQFDQWHKYWDEFAAVLGCSTNRAEAEIEILFNHAHLLKSLFTEDIEDFSNAITGIVQI